MRALCVVCGLSVLLAACDDDDEKPAGDLGGADQASVADQGPAPDQGPSEGGPKPDSPVGPDLMPAIDYGPIDAIIPKSNSGAICTVSNPTCPSPDEECIYFDVSTGKGMCLGRCNHQGQICPVADKSTQISVCSVHGLDPTKWFCGWFCKLQGATYKCPNDTDYKCVAEATGLAEYCHPK